MAGATKMSKESRKRLRFLNEEERKLHTAKRKKDYDKRRVNLGDAFNEWERCRLDEGFDSQVAWVRHLLDLHGRSCEKGVTARYHPSHSDRLLPSTIDVCEEKSSSFVSSTPTKRKESEDVIELPSPTCSRTPSVHGNTSSAYSPELHVPKSQGHSRTPIRGVSLSGPVPITSTPKVAGSVPKFRPQQMEDWVDSDEEEQTAVSGKDSLVADEDIISMSFDDIPDWVCPVDEVIKMPSLSSLRSKSISRSDAVAAKKCIAFNSSLVELVKLATGETCRKCGGDLEFKEVIRASCLVVTWKCKANKQHVGSWASQPRLKKMYAGNLLIPACLVLSGNNYAKVALMAKFLNLGFVGESNFYRIQRQYVFPAVKAHWENFQDELFEGKTCMQLAGDGRNDSPGHNAQYCTYSMMDQDFKKVVAISVVDVRQASGRSPNMEKVGFLDTFTQVSKRVQIDEIVTDAHVQIKALMKKDERFKDITHQFDVWHVSKNLTKKLIAAGREKGCMDILPWIPSIRNHLWHSAMCCKGNEERLKEQWVTVLHHVCNRHTWLNQMGNRETCAHPVPLADDERDKPWIKSGSKCYQNLTKLIWDKHLLSNLGYIKNFRHTSWLELFHGHLLMYCSKRNSYSYLGYTLRNILAAIDFNYHADRAIARDQEGNIRYKESYSKASKEWSVHPVKVQKDYGYIPGLLYDIVEEREFSDVRLDAKAELLPDDPVRLGRNIAIKPKPAKKVLIKKFEERAKKQLETAHQTE